MHTTTGTDFKVHTVYRSGNSLMGNDVINQNFELLGFKFVTDKATQTVGSSKLKTLLP